MNLNKLSKDELVKMLEQSVANQATGLMVKVNSGGGFYIRSDKFQEYSTAKDKFYTAGINIPRNTAKVLFNDTVLLDAIKAEINKQVD